jgi:hypothetical protein
MFFGFCNFSSWGCLGGRACFVFGIQTALLLNNHPFERADNGSVPTGALRDMRDRFCVVRMAERTICNHRHLPGSGDCDAILRP